MGYLAGGPSQNVARVTVEAAATANQTIIPVPGGFVPGYCDVFVGGACLSGSKGDYDDSDGASVKLTKQMAVGTQYRVVAYNPLNALTLNPSAYVQKAGDTMTGPLAFSGAGLRILGDFSNAVVANKLIFQSSTLNGITSVAAIPNGTATNASYTVYSSKDPANSQYGYLSAEASSGVVSIGANAIGSASQPIMQFNVAGAERMRIDTAGVIYASGAIRSTAEVQAFAQLRAYGTNYGAMFRCDDAAVYLMQTASGDKYGQWNSYRPFTWALSTGAITIDGTGAGITIGGKLVMGAVNAQFMVGQSTINTDQATGRTAYPGTSINGQGAVYNQVNSDTNMYISKAAGYTAGGYLTFMNNNAAAGSIALTGATTISYNTSSDYRLKENVKELIDGLDRVMLMRPVSFEWITDGHAARGFLAHELQEIEPDAVTGTKDAVGISPLDPEGPAVPQYQGIDLSFCIPDMVSAIQELKLALDAALNRIAVLEGEAP